MATRRELEPIIFTNEDLEPIVVPVTIGDENFTLREASDVAARRWRNAWIKCIKTNRETNIGTIEGLADTDVVLISNCLFDSRNMPVAEGRVRKWKPSIQKYLFDTIKEISDLNEEEQSEEQLEKKIASLQTKLDSKREAREKKEHPLANGSSSVEN